MDCKSFRFVVATKVCKLHNKVPDATRISSENDHPVYYVRASAVETMNKRSRQAATTEEHRETRILFASLVVYTRLSQLTLDRNKSSIATYKFIKPVAILAMSYNPILRRIFLATEGPHAIISSVLDSMTTTSIRRGFYTALAVDGRRKLLFCVHRFDIHSMTTHGKLFKVVPRVTSKYGCIIKNIGVDSSVRTIFLVQYDNAAATNKLLSVDYFGENMQVFWSNDVIGVYLVVFEPSTQLLVYNLNKKVKQLNITTHTQSDLTSADHLQTIFVDQSVVYIMDDNTLKMFERGVYKRLVNLPHSDDLRTFCVIH